MWYVSNVTPTVNLLPLEGTCFGVCSLYAKKSVTSLLQPKTPHDSYPATPKQQPDHHLPPPTPQLRPRNLYRVVYSTQSLIDSATGASTHERELCIATNGLWASSEPTRFIPAQLEALGHRPNSSTMSSTPMDLDPPAGSNGSPSLNISRNLAASAPVSNLSDVVSSFRPTKVRFCLPYCHCLPSIEP